MLTSNALRKLDMQDLMVFIAVHEQQNVTAVAEALHVSQSTVSYCLKKLRGAFDDELFISTRAGMLPTLKASAMLEPLRQIIERINLCHSGLAAYDPGQQAVTFNLCAPEYFELLVLPRLLRHFDAEQRRVTINVRKLDSHAPSEELADGRLDLVLGFGPDFHPPHPDFKCQVLVEDELVCVFAKAAAPAEARLSLQGFLERRHVFPTPWTSDTNMIDGWLARQGHKRQFVAQTNSYGAALKMIADSPLVVTMPRRIHRLLASADAFASREVPHGLPGFNLYMQWGDPGSANQWLREQIVKACADGGLI